MDKKEKSNKLKVISSIGMLVVILGFKVYPVYKDYNEYEDIKKENKKYENAYSEWMYLVTDINKGMYDLEDMNDLNSIKVKGLNKVKSKIGDNIEFKFKNKDAIAFNNDVWSTSLDKKYKFNEHLDKQLNYFKNKEYYILYSKENNQDNFKYKDVIISYKDIIYVKDKERINSIENKYHEDYLNIKSKIKRGLKLEKELDKMIEKGKTPAIKNTPFKKGDDDLYQYFKEDVNNFKKLKDNINIDKE